MEKIYAKANQKYVMNVRLYADSNSVLCYDSAKTDKVPASMVKELFDKNLLLVKTDDGEFKPTVFEDKTTYYAVTAIIMGQSVAEALTFKSDTIA